MKWRDSQNDREREKDKELIESNSIKVFLLSFKRLFNWIHFILHFFCSPSERERESLSFISSLSPRCTSSWNICIMFTMSVHTHKYDDHSNDDLMIQTLIHSLHYDLKNKTTMKGRERIDDFCFTPDHQLSSSSTFFFVNFLLLHSSFFIFSAKNVPFYGFEKKLTKKEKN